jgi:hypothetical protein
MLLSLGPLDSFQIFYKVEEELDVECSFSCLR